VADVPNDAAGPAGQVSGARTSSARVDRRMPGTVAPRWRGDRAGLDSGLTVTRGSVGLPAPRRWCRR
jgi:hypothetical protein